MERQPTEIPRVDLENIVTNSIKAAKDLTKEEIKSLTEWLENKPETTSRQSFISQYGGGCPVVACGIVRFEDKERLFLTTTPGSLQFSEAFDQLTRPYTMPGSRSVLKIDVSD